MLSLGVNCAHGETGDESISEFRRCYSQFDFDKNTVLVELWGNAADVNELGFGAVSTQGISLDAAFIFHGLDRRWIFGRDSEFSFIITPDGSGLYYDFSNVDSGEGTKPSQIFKCVSQ